MSEKENKIYDGKNIKHLDDIDHIRLRSSMYIGSKYAYGIYKLDREPIQNVLDEALVGYGNKCIFDINTKTGLTICEDWGRGIPTDKIKVILTTQHNGGKYDEQTYKYHSGSNGLGSCVLSACSKWLKCEVYRESYIDRDGKKVPAKHGWVITEKGRCKDEFYEDLPNGIPVDKHVGTTFSYIIDDELLESNEHSINKLMDYFDTVSYETPGFEFDFIVDGKLTKIRHDGGQVEHLKNFTNKRKIKCIIPLVEVTGTNKRFDFNILFTYSTSNSGDSNIISYVNGNTTPLHGYHVSAMKAGIGMALTQYINETDSVPKGLSNINVSGALISDNIVAVIGVHHVDPLFDGQTKDSFKSQDVTEPIKQACRSVFIKWLYDNPKEAKKLVDMAIDYAKYEAEKKKLKENMIKTKTVKSAFAANGIDPTKYIQCTSNNPEEKELFIVEGQSAGGSASKVMKSKYQALYKLKGKTLNVARANINTINNKELLDIMQILGMGMPSNPNYKNLQFNNIIIMTDADDDGAHITSLMLTFFYLAYPKLIEDGHVYIAQPPIKSIVLHNGTSIYLHTEADYQRIMTECIVNSFELHSIKNKKKLSEGFFRCFIKACEGYDLMLENFCNALSLDPELLELVCVYINDLIDGKWKIFNQNGYEVHQNKNMFIFDKGIKHMNLIIDDEFIDHTYNIIFDKLRDIQFYGFYLKGLRSGKEYRGTIYHLIKIMYDVLGSGITIKRFKGLGEMDPDELWTTALDPNTRTLTKVTINDAEKAKRSVDVFMGSDSGENSEFKRKFFAGEVSFD